MSTTYFCGHCEDEVAGPHAGLRSDGRPLCGRCHGAPLPAPPRPGRSFSALLTSVGLLVDVVVRATL
ncbi:MAG TPA: hypothetical protein VNM14_26245 [Planctomycetota bacterium]|nr:hypothetical protein [Planctomycetota bacterium]